MTGIKNLWKAVTAGILVAIICFAAEAQQSTFLDNPYKYLEDVSLFEWNQTAGHTVCIPARTTNEALILQKSKSENVVMLNGTWKFHFGATPEETPKDFYQPNFNDKGWFDITVPSNWEMQGYGDPLFRNVSQPFHAHPPFVPKEYNPTGSYRRTFTLPANWSGKNIFLRMEKTASASFVWINGQEVGYNEGAQEPAEYEVSKYLKPGKNLIAVNVYKYSDGVYLEDQDYWRLAGIFDDVWLYATPEIHLFDWHAVTDLDENYAHSELKLEVTVANQSKVTQSNYAIRATLLDNSGAKVTSFSSSPFQVVSASKQLISLTSHVENPKKWSAEEPNLYHLTMELIAGDGKVAEVIAGRIGFKETEIRNQVFYLNGKSIKLNAINSHMQHPLTGHSMDQATIRKDFEILKQFNINCVRTSHYPPVERYLELADEYGLYIIDETGDESHATEYVSKLADWEPMYRERVRKMVLRDRNHPSILFWSAGNESGEGKNICAVIDEGRKYDTTRSWMYGGNAFAHPCEEIIGPRYPTPFELKTQVGMIPQSVDPRPSFMDEYLSVAGNGGGGLDDYWQVIYQYPRIMGGAIWDFVSPGLSEPVRKITDSSPNQVPANLMGRAKLVEGHQGKGIDLNGHDQWVEVYQDQKLELTGNELTLSLWLYPRKLMSMGGTILTKGNYQYGLRQIGTDSLEFYLYTSKKERIKAALPGNWMQNWHHLAAVYDGKKMALYLDNKQLVEKSVTGNLTNFPFPVNIGKNAELDGQETRDYLCDAMLDQVAVFRKAVNVGDLFNNRLELKKEAALWLDFENEQTDGRFFSYGIGARTYGSIWPDRVPEPEMWQFKKSAQPIYAAWSDPEKLEIELYNRQYFKDLQDYDVRWNLEENGSTIAAGKLAVNCGPQSQKRVKLPVEKPTIKAGAIYLLTISCQLKNLTIWAPKGHEVAWTQLEMPWSVPVEKVIVKNQTDQLKVTEDDQKLVISGTDFQLAFSKKDGQLTSMNYQGKEMLKKGPQLNVWRAPLANEQDDWTTYSVNVIPKTEGYSNTISTSWYALGLDKMKYLLETFEHQEKNGGVAVHLHEVVLFGNSANAGFDNDMSFLISPDGAIQIDHTINPSGKMPVWLPRIGTSWTLSQELDQVEWFGRGPQENYPDRKTGYRIGSFQSTVEAMFVPYLKPEDNGLRTDNRWVRLLDQEGAGLEFSAAQPFNFNCYNYTTENLSKSKFTYQLVKSDGIIFNFDYRSTGVGCTARSVFNKYQTIPQFLQFTSFVKLVKPVLKPKLAGGILRQFPNFSSKYITTRNVDVWLPADFDARKKYAVLYMHDGKSLFDSTIMWNRQEWKIDETMSALLKAKKIRNCIVVGVYNGEATRHSDYFPQKPFEALSLLKQDSIYKVTRNEKFTLFSGKIQSDNYLKFLVEELKPFIDKTFPTLPDVNNTFVAGSSMGGLISLYAICEYPEVFGGAACLSTHWVGTFATENNPIPAVFMNYFGLHLPDPASHKIYFDYGDQTLDSLYEPYQLKMDEIMRLKGFTAKNWLTKAFPGADHSEKSWSKRMNIPLVFLLKN